MNNRIQITEVNNRNKNNWKWTIGVKLTGCEKSR